MEFSSVVHTVKLGGKGRNVLTLGDRTRAWVQRMSKSVCAAGENIDPVPDREGGAGCSQEAWRAAGACHP